jgi:hypothetical protein
MLKRAYRVTSTHQSVLGKTYVRSRCFFTQHNARLSFMRLVKVMEGTSKPSHWGKVLDVEYAESEPLRWHPKPPEWRPW